MTVRRPMQSAPRLEPEAERSADEQAFRSEVRERLDAAAMVQRWMVLLALATIALIAL